MTGAELDVPAVLTAADRLLRALRGPLGGAATWEWGDLLAAATGRSPFEMTGVVRSVDPRVPDPSKAQPADVAAQVLRLAEAVDDETGAARLRQVARLLDPAGGGPTGQPAIPPGPATAQPSPALAPPPQPPPAQAPPRQQPPPPARQPSVPRPTEQQPPAPRSPERQPPAQVPPAQRFGQLPPPPSEPARTVLPGQPTEPYRGGLSDVTGAPDVPSSGRRRAPATPKKRKRAGPWIGLAVIAYFIVRGYVESGGS